MSFGRIIDLTVLLVAIVGVAVMVFTSGAILDPLGDSLVDSGIDGKYNAASNFDDIEQAVTVWVPLTGLLGLIVVLGFREYRRQRLAARRRI